MIHIQVLANLPHDVVSYDDVIELNLWAMAIIF